MCGSGFNRAAVLSALVGLCAATMGQGAAAAPAPAASWPSAMFLKLDVPPGAQIDHVFSRTVSTTAPGFDETAGRNSGTSDWTVVSSTPAATRMKGGYHYDGSPPVTQVMEIREGAIGCFDDACAPLTDASGYVFSTRVWGQPPARLKVGDHWTVDLPDAWELGPPGRQEVTVRRIDAAAGAIVLERRGEGTGAWLSDPKTVRLKHGGAETQVPFTSGTAKWWGYATIRHGLVISDDLISQRELALSLGSGPAKAVQRQYILMNLAPPPPA